MIIFAAGILKRSCWITYKRWLLNLAVFFCMSWGLDMIIIPAENYFQLLFSAVLISAIVITVFMIANAVFERKVARYIIKRTYNAIRVLKKI